MKKIHCVCHVHVFCAIVLVFACTAFSCRTLFADSFDWTSVGGSNWLTPVKNQFGGTCWAFAAVGTFEARYKLTRNDASYNPDMSEQQLVWETDPNMGGTNGGHPMAAMNYMATHGVVSEAECPYQSSSPDVGISPYWPLSSGWETRCWKCTTTSTHFNNTTTSIKAALKTYGPSAICLNASNDLYGSVSALIATINAGTTTPTTDNGHEVVLVGYVDDSSLSCGGYWIIKNSWGTGYGTNGYYYVPYGYLEIHDSTYGLTGSVYYTGSMGTATWSGSSGTWVKGESTNWTFSGGTYTSWQNEEILAMFSATGSTVNLSGSVIAHGLNITGSGYVFKGGSLTVTAGGITTTQDVTISSPITVGAPQTWTIASGTTLNIDGALHTIINDLTIANEGTVYLNGGIDGGGVLNTYGAAPGNITKTGTGCLYITGTMNSMNNLDISTGAVHFIGSTLSVAGTLSLDSSGALSITNGGTVSSSYGYIGQGSGSTGLVTVDGAGSTWTNSSDVVVGCYGCGTLMITAAGVVSDTNGFLGLTSGSTGTLTLDGSDSTWTNSASLYVGHYGSGTLSITGGGAVSNTNGFLGLASGSTGTVTVDGSGSTWTNRNALYVGEYGGGMLSITNGGSVSNTYGYIGVYSGSTGTVTVDGSGSTWTNSNALYVGNSGSGTLKIT
ncbi:MAG: C1 family peptidase, partial [Thermoguttaceae bacterium]